MDAIHNCISKSFLFKLRFMPVLIKLPSILMGKYGKILNYRELKDDAHNC